MPGSFVLPLVLGLPILGAIFVMFTPKTETALHRGIGMTFMVLTLLASVLVLAYFVSADPRLPIDAQVAGNPRLAAFQLVYDIEWIPGLGAHFKLGVDGISVFLVLLTTLLMPLTLLGTGNAIDKNVREFIAALLVLETGMLGAFVALDVFLFYVFWEVMLIPMYLLIGIWGGPRRLYASIKFVVYTMVGSLLMLVAIFYVYVKAGSAIGVYTTDLEKLMNVALPYQAQIWCFAAFALAFAIKIPLFPLHTWLPDAHVEAPTAGSVILAGVLLKFGIYGFLRYAIPLFPQGAVYWGPAISLLAVIGIIYGALVAFAQDDVKKLVAYSSVSHLGFCALGVFAMTSYGISGSIYAMLSHGLTTGGLFLGIGVLYERRHTRRLAEYGGIWKQMPIFAGLFLIIVMGSAGLPALSGFVGEFLTILGTFVAGDEPVQGYDFLAPHVLGALAATGVVLGAIYLLWMFQKVFFGKLDKAKNGRLPDLSGRELLTFIPLIIGIFLMGLFPRPLLIVMEPSVTKLIKDFAHRVKECDGVPHLYDSTDSGCGPGASGPPTAKPVATPPRSVDGPAAGSAAPRPLGNGAPPNAANAAPGTAAVVPGSAAGSAVAPGAAASDGASGAGSAAPAGGGAAGSLPAGPAPTVVDPGSGSGSAVAPDGGAAGPGAAAGSAATPGDGSAAPVRRGGVTPGRPARPRGAPGAGSGSAGTRRRTP